jgi:hypothetical protein
VYQNLNPEYFSPNYLKIFENPSSKNTSIKKDLSIRELLTAVFELNQCITTQINYEVCCLLTQLKSEGLSLTSLVDSLLNLDSSWRVCNNESAEK